MSEETQRKDTKKAWIPYGEIKRGIPILYNSIKYYKIM